MNSQIRTGGYKKGTYREQKESLGNQNLVAEIKNCREV